MESRLLVLGHVFFQKSTRVRDLPLLIHISISNLVAEEPLIIFNQATECSNVHLARVCIERRIDRDFRLRCLRRCARNCHLANGIGLRVQRNHDGRNDAVGCLAALNGTRDHVDGVPAAVLDFLLVSQLLFHEEAPAEPRLLRVNEVDRTHGVVIV